MPGINLSYSEEHFTNHHIHDIWDEETEMWQNRWGFYKVRCCLVPLFEQNWSIMPPSKHGSHGLFQIVQIYLFMIFNFLVFAKINKSIKTQCCIKWQIDTVEGEN